MGGGNNEDYPDLALTKEKPESVVFRLPCGVLFMRYTVMIQLVKESWSKE